MARKPPFLGFPEGLCRHLHKIGLPWAGLDCLRLYYIVCRRRGSGFMKEKPRNRFSPGNPQQPLREWDWDGDEFAGTLELVPLERGWPPEGEAITDAVASFAISHRKRDIIARYLRQPNPAPHIISRIADLFDPAKDGTEADRLVFVKRRNNHPMLKQRADRYHYQIGYGISQLMQSMPFEQAIRKARLKYGVERTAAIDAYNYYRTEQKQKQSTGEKSEKNLTAPD